MQGDVTFPAGSRFEGGWRCSAARSASPAGSGADVAVANGTLYLLPGADVEGDDPGRGRPADPEPEQARARRAASGCIWDAAPVIRTPEGTLVLRERRRSLGELATARTTFQTGRVRTTLLARHRRHLQPDRGAADRLRPDCSSSGPPRASLRPARPARHPPHRGRGRPSSAATSATCARADLRFPGSRVRHRRAALQRGRADRGPAALAQPRSAGRRSCSSATTATTSSGRASAASAWVQPHRALRFELSLRPRRESARCGPPIPWSLLRNSDRWRRNPLIDDGHYFTTGLQLDFDTRNDRDRPTTGWLIRARLRALAPATTSRRWRCPRRCVRRSPTGGGYALRPAPARSPALLPADTRRCG